MKGTRPLDNSEIQLIAACFDGVFEACNRRFFMLRVSTGRCISELLGLLRVANVYQNGLPVTERSQHCLSHAP